MLGSGVAVDRVVTLRSRLAALFMVLDFSHVYHVEYSIDIALGAVVAAPLISIAVPSWLSGGRRLYGVALLAVGLLVVVGVGGLARNYGQAEGESARKGDPLHNTLSGFSFPPLSATPLKVQLIDPLSGDPQPTPFQPRQCLLELGESDGYVVLFDVPSHTVYRLPSNSVVLSEVQGTKPGCIESTKK
jgi:hypothetical protein